jgi:hypothetical protein
MGMQGRICAGGDFGLSSATPNAISMENSQDFAEGQAHQEHLLDDIEYTYTQARSDKRFGDYFIDRVIFYLLWKFLLVKYAVQVILFLRVPVDDPFVLWAVSYLMAASMLVVYRLTPLEAFSALGSNPPYPWHDRWTNTLVIVESRSDLPPTE